MRIGVFDGLGLLAVRPGQYQNPVHLLLRHTIFLLHVAQDGQGRFSLFGSFADLVHVAAHDAGVFVIAAHQRCRGRSDRLRQLVVGLGQLLGLVTLIHGPFGNGGILLHFGQGLEFFQGHVQRALQVAHGLRRFIGAVAHHQEASGNRCGSNGQSGRAAQQAEDGAASGGGGGLRHGQPVGGHGFGNGGVGAGCAGGYFRRFGCGHGLSGGQCDHTKLALGLQGSHRRRHLRFGTLQGRCRKLTVKCSLSEGLPGALDFDLLLYAVGCGGADGFGDALTHGDGASDDGFGQVPGSQRCGSSGSQIKVFSQQADGLGQRIGRSAAVFTHKFGEGVLQLGEVLGHGFSGFAEVCVNAIGGLLQGLGDAAGGQFAVVGHVAERTDGHVQPFGQCQRKAGGLLHDAVEFLAAQRPRTKCLPELLQGGFGTFG